MNASHKIFIQLKTIKPFGFALFLIILFVLPALNISAQNIGIGTPAPQKLLSVNGSIVLDQGNKNSGGLDSAALLFGTSGGVGILSKKMGVSPLNGLSFFTNNQNRLNIGSSGLVSITGALEGTSADFSANLIVGSTATIGASAWIGNNLHVANDGIIENNFRINGRLGVLGATNANYGLIVNNSNSYFQGNTTTTGNATVQGALNVTGSGIIDENFRVNGRVGINGATNSNYGLIVNNSNSYFQGNTTTTGTVNANGNLTIKGNGHVRSNGTSNLKIGFTSKTVNVFIANGASVSVTANISDFTGGVDDARVFVSQVVNDPTGFLSWSKVKITVMGVNATDDTCLLWIHNTSGVSGDLKGTIYLTTIARE